MQKKYNRNIFVPIAVRQSSNIKLLTEILVTQNENLTWKIKETAFQK